MSKPSLLRVLRVYVSVWRAEFMVWAKGERLDARYPYSGLTWSYGPLLSTIALFFFALVAILTIVWIPEHQVRHWPASLDWKERLAHANELRRTMIQFWGGLVVLVGLYSGWRRLVATDDANQLQRERLQSDRDGQITERFTKTVEQLAHVQMEVRIGAIYILERLASESPRDSWAIVQILSGYVRGNAAVPKPPSPDVQAALTALGRRPWREAESASQRIDFSGAFLARYDLSNAKFRRLMAVNTVFSGCTLVGVDFTGAKLTGAKFDFVAAYKGVFDSANAIKSTWDAADLRYVQMIGTNLRSASMKAANFTGANLTAARLDHTDLTDARGISASSKA